MKQDEARQICILKTRPLTPEEQKKMDKISDAISKKDDCHD